jgi:hypothetical protein
MSFLPTGGVSVWLVPNEEGAYTIDSSYVYFEL